MVASAGRGNLESKRPWPRRERGPRGQPAWGGTQGAAIRAETARRGGHWPAGRAMMVGQPRADPSLPQSRHTAVSPAQASIWGQGHAEGQTVFSGRYAEPRPKSWPPKSVGLTCWTIPCCAQPFSTQGPGRLRGVPHSSGSSRGLRLTEQLSCSLHGGGRVGRAQRDLRAVGGERPAPP